MQTLTVEAGASEVIEAVYRAESERLWRALLLFSGNKELASDTVAEAFVQALAHRGRIRDPRAWVWRSAFRIAAGELKRRRQEGAYLAAGSYDLAEVSVEVSEALKKLSAKQRGAIVLHYYVGYTHGQAAAALGSTPAAIAVHLHRARRRLRELLEVNDEATA